MNLEIAYFSNYEIQTRINFESINQRLMNLTFTALVHQLRFLFLKTATLYELRILDSNFLKDLSNEIKSLYIRRKSGETIS